MASISKSRRVSIGGPRPLLSKSNSAASALTVTKDIKTPSSLHKKPSSVTVRHWSPSWAWFFQKKEEKVTLFIRPRWRQFHPKLQRCGGRRKHWKSSWLCRGEQQLQFEFGKASSELTEAIPLQTSDDGLGRKERSIDGPYQCAGRLAGEEKGPARLH